MTAKTRITWATKKLEEICTQITDGKHGDCQDQPNSGFYFLSCKDVSNGILNYNGARQIAEVDFHDTHRRTKLAPSDILITNSGTIGRMALVPDNELTQRTTFQKSVAILKPIPNYVEPSFLFYAIQGDLRRLIEFAGGSAQKNLLLRDLRAFQVPVPEIDLQRRIASILGAYDDLIEVNRRRIAVLEEMARRLFDEWFVNFRFPGHERHEMVKTTSGMVPQGWEFRELSAIAELRMGQSPPSETYNESGNGLPFHQGVSNFGPHFPIDRVFTTAVDTDRIGEPGDILFSVRAPVGRINVSLSRIVLGRGVAAVRGNETHTFILEAIRQRFQETDQIGNGTIFKSVTKRDMSNIALIWPPFEFRQRFDGFCAPFWAQLRTLTIASRNLTASRDLILPRLISGELSVATAEQELEAAA